MLVFRLFCLAVLSTPLLAARSFAYDAVVETVPVPYEVVELLGDYQLNKTVLGELENAPEMYEIKIEATSTLAVELRAVPMAETESTFSGIIIRQKETRGIEEVARLEAREAKWNRLLDGQTGLPYLAGSFYSETVSPGTYRIEVSNPNNQGKYLLLIGTNNDEEGYFASLRAVITTYEFYGESKLKLFNSPYVHYPLGILILIILISVTVYKTRHRFITST